MKLVIGNKYKLSTKIKRALGVLVDEAKVITISNGIVMLQIGAEVFPLKETIAFNNLTKSEKISAIIKPTVEEEPVIEEPIIEEPIVEEEPENEGGFTIEDIDEVMNTEPAKIKVRRIDTNENIRRIRKPSLNKTLTEFKQSG